MLVKIIGTIIGALIAISGIYYLAKEKHDPESRKIYSIAVAVGSIIFVVMLILTILALI